MNIYCLQCCFRRPTLVLLSGILLIILFLVIKQNFPKAHQNYHASGIWRRNISNNYEDHGQLTNNKDSQREKEDLLLRIEDLRRIKASVRNELRSIEGEKGKLLREKAILINKNDKLLTQISRSKSQLKQLELDIHANRKRKFEKNCDIESIPPIIFNPFKSIELSKVSYRTDLNSVENTISNNQSTTINSSFKQQFRKHQFDFSDCSLANEFKFYLSEENHIKNDDDVDISNSQYQTLEEILKSHAQYTHDINQACIVIIITRGPSLSSKTISFPENKNTLIIANSILSDFELNLPDNVAIASSFAIKQHNFRDEFDIVLPSMWQQPNNFELIIGAMPPHSPIDRKYLACYFSRNPNEDEEYSRIHLSSIEETLRVIHRNSIDDLFLFSYSCDQNLSEKCDNHDLDSTLGMSTFNLIVAETLENLTIDNHVNTQLYMSLFKGTIPVIIGKEKVKLPFEEVLDWRKASILLHSARLPEVHFILRSMTTVDLYQMKYHGRRISETYFATSKQIIDTIISLISVHRFGYPPPPVQDIKTISYYDQIFHKGNNNNRMVIDVNCTANECVEVKNNAMNNHLLDEILGPREAPLASETYRRNFSLVLNSAYDLWNSPIYSPHQLYPSYPIDPIPPSEYKFFSNQRNYRPINDGLGGSGLEFSRSLGGEHINEQFTIVLLTYERNSLLMKTLERLKGMPYLNKILVVWNGIRHEPPADMIWPDVGAPILVVKVGRNSLNNRFLPYDAIETDAILSLDDDSPLRKDEIVFGFRVWRESRDRIVGFPGRFHAWNEDQHSWMYNSNHSCELSMVLTGGAFFHKYYTYIYTYSMPQVIHSIVDKFMNCEDIAMNFLVAHLTRKPPIKVTSRWTFHCASCTSSLSEDDSHFRERHECLNTFVSIYGYMPLLNTQHRSDSVLFKTKLPQDKQKCFKFV